MSVEEDLGPERLARLRDIRMGVGKVQTLAWRAAALIDALDIIDELVVMRKTEVLPAEQAESVLREMSELRAMLDSCRKERSELQQKVWKR